MSFMRNQNAEVRQQEPMPVPEMRETTGAGPLAVADGVQGSAAYAPPRRVPARRKLERIGYWVIVAAALLILLVVLGFVLRPVVGGLITASYMGAFVGGLTLMNLPRMSGWANAVLGRRVFPVVQAQSGELWRLSLVNAGLMFAFAFAFEVLAYFLGALFAGILVFGGLIAAAIFYNRARQIIIKP